MARPRPVERAAAESTATAALETAQVPQRGLEASAAAGLAEIIQVVVQRNDTLDQIFRRLELSLADLASILTLEPARDALNRIRPGEQLTLLRRGSELIGLTRALSLSQTLRIERDATDQFIASVEDVPLVRRMVTASGSINSSSSSLFAAGGEAGLRDLTIGELAEIFRFDVDFNLDLREGDSFTLVYEQLEKDGKIVGDGNILAAEFVNAGQRFRAVRYETTPGKVDFYTPEGTSLRKAFLKTPVQFLRISSVFNPRRRHPVLNTIRAHRGVDYAAPTGTKIYAAGAGRVQFRGVKGGLGNAVEIAHSGGVVTRYGHMSRFASGLKTGQRVEQGQVIGYVGSTGLATGPHLHFEYIERGNYIDPQKAMKRAEPGPPIPAAERAAFGLTAAALLARLDAGPVRALSADTALAAR